MRRVFVLGGVLYVFWLAAMGALAQPGDLILLMGALAFDCPPVRAPDATHQEDIGSALRPGHPDVGIASIGQPSVEPESDSVQGCTLSTPNSGRPAVGYWQELSTLPAYGVDENWHPLVGLQQENVGTEHFSHHAGIAVDEAALLVNVMRQPHSHPRSYGDLVALGGDASALRQNRSCLGKLQLEPGQVQ